MSDDLEIFSAQIREFWKVKRKTKTQAAWNLLMRELIKIQNKYGPDVVKSQLELATANGWKSVTLANYENYARPANASKFHQPEPVSNHPAHQVFKASDLGPEWERHIPSATGGKGVLDEGVF